MASRMKIVLSSPEEILIKEGDSLNSDSAMYFLASGSCIVEQKDIVNYNGKSTPIGHLQTGDYFGVSLKFLLISFL
jgi:CRP-like cAMP-binding protein